MRVGKISLAVVAGSVLLAGTVAAQEGKPGEAGNIVVVQGPGPGGPGPMTFFGERIELLGFGEMHGDKVVSGAPFSAVAISEMTQTLADGNKISRTTQSNLYRDGQGRFRKEVTLPAIGPLAAQGQPKSFVVIQDPVAGKSYVLEAEQKIARVLPVRGKRLREGEGFRTFGKKFEAGADNVQKDDLGTQNINGVNAQGTRYTRTIPAGQIGNEKPITIVSESWYSPDLQMVIMSKRSDPRFGDTTYQLTKIQRSEPVAGLFSVPSDYTIKQGKPERHMKFKQKGAMPVPPPPGDEPPPGI